MQAPYKVLHDVSQFINPLIIHEIVHLIENDSSDVGLAYALAGCMFGASQLQSVALGQYNARGNRLGLNIQSAVNEAVYVKVARREWLPI